MCSLIGLTLQPKIVISEILSDTGILQQNENVRRALGAFDDPSHQCKRVVMRVDRSTSDQTRHVACLVALAILAHVVYLLLCNPFLMGVIFGRLEKSKCSGVTLLNLGNPQWH